MFRQKPNLAFFSIVLICATTMATTFAANTAMPTYPSATNNLQGMPANSGMMQLVTSDAADKVDSWYGAHLPKTCKHETASGGAKYACPGNNIMITPDKGKTVITHMASWIGGH